LISPAAEKQLVKEYHLSISKGNANSWRLVWEKLIERDEIEK